MIVTRLPLSFALALPIVFAACGGEGLTLPPEGEPAHISVIDGDKQSGLVGSTLGEPLLVEVTDTRNLPVAGATVIFSITSAATAKAAPASAITNSDGRATSTLTLGSTPGTVTGKVEVPMDEGVRSVEASFTATAVSDDAEAIAYVSGGDQRAPVNSTLPAPLVVRVTDQFGNPVQGVTVAWTIEGGGTVSEASSVTDANGHASVTRELGGNAGQQTTSATVGGLRGSPVIFTHTATAGTPTGVVKVDGDNQSAMVGTELAKPLVVQVLDAQGNPIPDRVVTWVTGDGSVNPQNTPTDAQGLASTRWTLGMTPGPNKTANAVVSGLQTATFTATATAGSPSGSTSTVSASPTTITAGGNSTIAVTVRDAGNNPISGVSVTPSASGSGNTINPSSAPSGSNGVATFTFSSMVAETKTITATAGGVTIEDQATITVQKASSIIEIESDDPDPSVVGQAVTVEFTVRGSGGTPTGTVTVSFSDGTSAEDCSTQLVDGAGSCSITPLTPGGPPNNRRIIRTTYSGDDRFSGDIDEENHRVDPVVAANDPPTADFAVPNCTVGQPCEFIGESTDGDGVIASRVWTFQDGNPASSTDPKPMVTFTSEGSKTVTLTVTDDDGATDSETKQVNVAPAGPPNQAPSAVNDEYSTPGEGEPLTVAAPGVLANDTDDGGSLTAGDPSPAGQGAVALSLDGSFTYTPNPGATGTDSFTYAASDGMLTSRATVTINITP